MSQDASAYRQGLLGDDSEIWDALDGLDRARTRYYARTGVGVRLGRLSAVARAQRYLAKIAPAVSGKRGRHALWSATCSIVRGFSLSVHEAMPLLQAWNASNDPPFTEAEIETTTWRAHRGEGGARKGYPLGYLLGAEVGAPATTFNVKTGTGT